MLYAMSHYCHSLCGSISNMKRGYTVHYLTDLFNFIFITLNFQQQTHFLIAFYCIRKQNILCMAIVSINKCKHSLLTFHTETYKIRI